ncbi:MAG: Eco57I restriction-modification methylase domain-containing protein, partial [Candidatus Ratteibacteria bacterium]
DLLKDGGILTFISSNKWMRAKYGEKLRKFLKEKTILKEIVDFGGYKVFDATVDTNIVVFEKKPSANVNKFFYLNVSDDFDGKDLYGYFNRNASVMRQEDLSDSVWTLADDKVLALKKKIEEKGIPLKDWGLNIYIGIITGFNEAFIIDTETRDKILANCKTDEERKRTEEIIKPVLRGRDIGKYYYKWAGLWIIGTFPALNLNIDNYPALK